MAHVDLGFEFPYFGRTATAIGISPNGFVRLLDSSSSSASTSMLNPGTGSGEMLPAPNYGALISPYWEHYDPSALTCGGTPGVVKYGEVQAEGKAGDGGRTFLVTFEEVRSCGGGYAATGSMTATWQLALHSVRCSAPSLVSGSRFIPGTEGRP